MIQKETVVITILTKVFAIFLVIYKSVSSRPWKHIDSLKPRECVPSES